MLRPKLVLKPQTKVFSMTEQPQLPSIGDKDIEYNNKRRYFKYKRLEHYVRKVERANRAMERANRTMERILFPLKWQTKGSTT
jgi:hypothetical protein